MRATFAIPGDLDTPTGGYVYARRLIAAAGDAGWTLAPLALPASFPDPSGEDIAEAGARLRAVEGPLLIDGLAYGALPEAVIDALPRAPTALCHHPLGLETGLTPARATALLAGEAAALARAAHVVVTSAATARDLTERLCVSAAKISVAPPGLDPAPPATGGGGGEILTVASATPRKGLNDLVAALSRLGDLDWRARIAGPLDRDPGCAAALARRIEAAGLTGRIRLLGPLAAEALARLYDETDIFCLPSRHEGYGMVFAEAMMRALPVIACRIPAAEALVPPAAGRLVAPGDIAALAAALRRYLTDGEARLAAGTAGRARAVTLPGWSETARIVRAALAAS